MTTPRTDRAEHFGLTSGECVLVHEDDMKKLELELAQLEQDHATTLRLHHEDKKKLETELIALQDYEKQRDKDVDSVLSERDKLIAERDQLIATVEGLKDILQEIKRENSATYREAAEIGYSDGMWIKPSISTKIEQALQFFPPTNLVKRSVLERVVPYLKTLTEQGFNFASAGLVIEAKEALKEAHEELQRTQQ